MSSRIKYNGSQRKLLLAFDVGTTYSGVSYSILDPGQVPQIKPITRFPAHEQITGASKIPTLIYYDSQGKVCAVGAEAIQEGMEVIAEDENWVKAEWFKFHLRSKVGTDLNISEDIPPLPLGKTVVQVFADFLNYLLQCASSYIQDTHANGPQLWASVRDNIEYVLSHPNGWGGTQQNKMRMAAVMGGLIPDSVAGHARLSFVTEGEASLHFSIQNGLPEAAMLNGEGIVMVDAGGGTIDISSYCRNMHAADGTFNEIAAPQCHFFGSVFVSLYARLFLEKLLVNSKFGDDVEHIVKCFDKTTKPRFRSIAKAQYIKFGSTKDNDPDVDIRFGQLKLSGSDVATFFQPSIDCIVKVTLNQINVAHKPISHVIIVGGFAANDWLFSKVHEKLSIHGLNVVRPENHLNKAVSDGAISFYLDHFVRTRVSKYTYGVISNVVYNENDPDHRMRNPTTFITLSGIRRVPNYFDVILPKNTQIKETKEFRKYYQVESQDKNFFDQWSVTVSGYKGNQENPKWKDIDPENYFNLCTVKFVNMPLVSDRNMFGPDNFFKLSFSIILLFGLTELQAQVAWFENNVEKRSPIRIMYDPET